MVTDKMKHIDMTTLPSDPHGMVSQFRRMLVTTVNTARGSDHKMVLIRDTLKYVLAHVEHGLKKPTTKKTRKAQEK